MTKEFVVLTVLTLHPDTVKTPVPAGVGSAITFSEICVSLPLIELGEFIEDASNGQSHDQQPTDDAQGSYQLPSKRNGKGVPVAHCSHADGGPPPAYGDSLQL